MKNFVTTKQFADVVKDLLLKSNELPNILEYNLSVSEQEIETIHDIEFDIKGDLVFGVSEGIYLRMYISGDFRREPGNNIAHLMTFKTLKETKEALVKMAELQAKYIWTAREYVNSHKKEFIRRGYLCEKPYGSARYYTLSHENLNKYVKNGYTKITDLYENKPIKLQ